MLVIWGFLLIICKHFFVEYVFLMMNVCKGFMGLLLLLMMFFKKTITISCELIESQEIKGLEIEPIKFA